MFGLATKKPLDTSIRATYEDGTILDETELNDVSPYDEKHNMLRAVLNREPELLHGKLKTFSVFWKNTRYNIDFTKLPDNAEPIRLRDGNRSLDTNGVEKFWWSAVRFGYRYTDENGKVIEEIREVH